MQTNPVVEQNKNVRLSESPWNQSVVVDWGKGLWWEGFAKESSADVIVSDKVIAEFTGFMW